MDTLSNKNVLITGATGGLGSEISSELSSHNCNLFLTGRNSKKLTKLVKTLSTDSGTIYSYASDLRNSSDIDNLIQETFATFPTIDILINCAGVFPVASFLKSSQQDFLDCFNVNVLAPYLLSKAFVGNMVAQRWGRIVNIGSSSSYQGYADTSIYCASKHALLGLSRSLYDEFQKDNVRVFSICPGSIKTKMGEKVKGQNYNTFIEPREIAQYIVFVIAFNKSMISEEIRLNRMDYS